MDEKTNTVRTGLLAWPEELRAVQATGVLSLAQVVLTSLITTSAGALVAVLSFAAQAKPLSKFGTVCAVAASTWIGGALVLALASAMLGYLYQYLLTYHEEQDFFWWTAILAIAGSLICLMTGGVIGLQLVRETVGPIP